MSRFKSSDELVGILFSLDVVGSYEEGLDLVQKLGDTCWLERDLKDPRKYLVIEKAICGDGTEGYTISVYTNNED